MDAEMRDALLHDVLAAAEVRLADSGLDLLGRLDVLEELIDEARELAESVLHDALDPVH